ncbi:unnamed protein product [Gordionus sp. m RMFG-2023]
MSSQGKVALHAKYASGPATIPMRQLGMRGTNINCFNCGGRGHKARDCASGVSTFYTLNNGLDRWAGGQQRRIMDDARLIAREAEEVAKRCWLYKFGQAAENKKVSLVRKNIDFNINGPELNGTEVEMSDSIEESLINAPVP